MDFLNKLRQGLIIPIVIIALLAMTILPLPPFLLDILFTFNIFLSLLILLVSIYTKRPLDFAIFPTILLIATLLRLALNIASTRVVLILGHNGPAAAGTVIHAFGNVVIGGNYAVGLVVFSILVIINFVVITKGSGRVSEVSARFTLDALPGKQMAIDADLNAGIITQEQAQQRRELVAQEADFYGSMDGASKFVRGDAIAGLLILFINLIGGFFIGIVQHGLSVVQSLEIFSLLTIGDGLVAQIPSLLLSTSAAIMVTRESKEQDMAAVIGKQIFQFRQPIAVSAGIIGILGLIPGMPHVPFLLMAGVISLWLYTTRESIEAEQAQSQLEESRQSPIKQGPLATQQPQLTAVDSERQEEKKQQDISWDDVQPTEQISLELGYRLISMTKGEQDVNLVSKLKGIRKKLSQELGFLVPIIHVKDNLQLGPSEYKVLLSGVEEAKFTLEIDKLLAINPGDAIEPLKGQETYEPSFGLQAYWIETSLKEQAQTAGYTVVDTATVVATHLSQIIHENASTMVGHEEVQKMLDILAETNPKLVEDTVPKKVSLSTLVIVMHNLLLDKIPVRDLRTIIETLAENAHVSADPKVLTEHVRAALSRLIIQQLNGNNTSIPVATLSPQLEDLLKRSFENSSNEQLVVEPSLLQKFQSALSQFCQTQENQGEPSILLVPPLLRSALSHLVKYAVSGLSVLSYSEIPANKKVNVISHIGD